MSKGIFSSRTVWLAIAQGVAGILVVIMTEYPELGYGALLKSILDVLLRMSTTKSIR